MRHAIKTGLWLLTGVTAFILLLQAATVGILTLRGYGCYAVYTGSMSPTLSIGDLVAVKPTAAEELAAGQIATFRAGGGDKTFTHRITLVDAEKGLVYTRGDGNDSADPEPTPIGNCIGTVGYVFPLFGFVYMFSRSGAGVAALLLLGLLWLSFEAELYFQKRRGRASCEND